MVTLLKLSNLEVLFLKKPQDQSGDESLEKSKGPRPREEADPPGMEGEDGKRSESESDEVVPFQFKSLTVSKNFCMEAKELIGQSVNSCHQNMESYTAYIASYYMLVNLTSPQVVLPFNILPLKYLLLT